MASSGRAGHGQAQAEMPSRDEFLKLPEDQRNQINEAFTVFDADKDSRIDYHEFRFSLRALGFDLPKQETYPFLTRYAIPPPNWPPQKECGPIWREFTLPIFQGIAGALMYNRDPIEECQRAYKLFDPEDKGMITLEDLRRVMGEIGQTMEEGELAAMIREFDSEGKGGVNEDEFVKMMLAKRQGWGTDGRYSLKSGELGDKEAPSFKSPLGIADSFRMASGQQLDRINLKARGEGVGFPKSGKALGLKTADL